MIWKGNCCVSIDVTKLVSVGLIFEGLSFVEEVEACVYSLCKVLIFVG